ncbi:hypothetical protein KC19_9G180200 [Ceratodon purpureus]|uniref:Uncharacterized protein n=1 Tax=Ceratodon purpureus TaxID=3225 RepID=A0A8T0GV56_CERPU|nr:hypothetical protein KC19_9G180200 [Ceratodon purpureus]
MEGAMGAFGEAMEALESTDLEEERAERVVRGACAAIDVLRDGMKGVEEFSADVGESKEWVHAVCVSWGSVVKGRRGVSVAEKLDSVAPNLLASWLDALKALGSCAVVAEGVILREKGLGRLDSGEVVDWIGEGFLSAVWPELKDRRGLRASRWRARVSAVEFLSSLAEYDLNGEKSNEQSLALLEDLLQALIFGMGLVDSQWQVRRAVVLAVTRLLTASLGLLAQPLWANLTWGVLAIYVDRQPEVQAVARDSVLQHLIPPSKVHSKDVVLNLLDKFIAAAFWKAETPDIASRDMSTLLGAVHAAVLLELVPHQRVFEVQEQENVNIDRVPLLVVAASFALAGFENEGNKAHTANLLHLLRSLGSYVTSLLGMLNPVMPLYECDKLARYCKRRGVLDEETAKTLERVPTATSLKGLATALEASESIMRNLSVDYNGESLGKKQLDALQHVSEMLRVPSQLTRNYKDGTTDGEVENYLLCGKLYIEMALILLKNPVWTTQQAWEKEEIVYDIVLSFSALASGIIESEKTWIDETGLCKLCNDAIGCFSKTLQEESSSSQDEAKPPSGGNNRRLSSLETLVLRLLPKILSRFKDILKVGTKSVSLELGSTVPKMDDLPAAIISAHQLRWCLTQVRYPNFKPHSELVIRTALTALDHYSPSIKREGMKTFTHLATNLSPTELRWFKDAILDAVTRSLIGCEYLWSVAVEMAVALVTQIEGGNPRGQWYGAIMKEMLEDLDRHRSDETRRIVWLQLVTPQFESMGIVLVAHFKNLLPLFYYWLHAQDETTQLLVLSNLRTIIRSTWPRIPFHALRIQEELSRAKNDGQERKSSSKFFAAIDDVERLLQLITSPSAAGVPE